MENVTAARNAFDMNMNMNMPNMLINTPEGQPGATPPGPGVEEKKKVAKPKVPKPKPQKLDRKPTSQGAGEEGQKSKKRKVSSGAPPKVIMAKKPFKKKTAYLFWKKTQPSTKGGKELQIEYRAMSAEEKKPFDDMALEDVARYDKEFAAYNLANAQQSVVSIEKLVQAFRKAKKSGKMDGHDQRVEAGKDFSRDTINYLAQTKETKPIHDRYRRLFDELQNLIQSPSGDGSKAGGSAKKKKKPAPSKQENQQQQEIEDSVDDLMPTNNDMQTLMPPVAGSPGGGMGDHSAIMQLQHHQQQQQQQQHMMMADQAMDPHVLNSEENQQIARQLIYYVQTRNHQALLQHCEMYRRLCATHAHMSGLNQTTPQAQALHMQHHQQHPNAQHPQYPSAQHEAMMQQYRYNSQHGKLHPQQEMQQQFVQGMHPQHPGMPSFAGMTPQQAAAAAAAAGYTGGSGAGNPSAAGSSSSSTQQMQQLSAAQQQQLSAAQQQQLSAAQQQQLSAAQQQQLSAVQQQQLSAAQQQQLGAAQQQQLSAAQQQQLSAAQQQQLGAAQQQQLSAAQQQQLSAAQQQQLGAAQQQQLSAAQQQQLSAAQQQQLGAAQQQQLSAAQQQQLSAAQQQQLQQQQQHDAPHSGQQQQQQQQHGAGVQGQPQHNGPNGQYYKGSGSSEPGSPSLGAYAQNQSFLQQLVFSGGGANTNQ